MPVRGVCVKQLLESNVRWLNRVRASGRPSSRVSGCACVIEYAPSSALLDAYSSASASGLRGSACELVRVTNSSGERVRKFPHVLRRALLGAAGARTNEKMAREFFGTLKRVGGVALREVGRPAKSASVPVVAPVRVPKAVPDAPDVDPM